MGEDTFLLPKSPCAFLSLSYAPLTFDRGCFFSPISYVDARGNIFLHGWVTAHLYKFGHDCFRKRTDAA